MKVLTLDIETTPNVADVWGLWQQNVGLNQLRETSRVFSFAAKWRGEKPVEFRSDFHDGHDTMVERAHALLDEADVLVTYNGKRFDIPHLRREFLQAGLTPPSPFAEVDLCQVVKSRFKFPSAKLDYVSQALGLGAKVKHAGHDLWVRVLAGEAKAWREMETYNRQDVVLTELLYLRLLPWIARHPHAGVLNGIEGESCQRCGSVDLEKRGFKLAGASVYQQLRCRGCGSWSRGNKRLGGTTARGVDS